VDDFEQPDANNRHRTTTLVTRSIRIPTSPWCDSQRRTEGGETPRWQGATTENIGQYLREEQRSQPGCPARKSLYK
jgi:hypothetical protein